jgi:CheY-like chemotaxis protein
MPARIRVLLVDDDPEQRESLTDLLEGLDCDVTTCCGPIDCLPISEASSYDLVLVDVKLPGMAPLELVRQIRPHGHRWIVVLWALSDPAETEAAFQAGADGVLEKPLPWEQLWSWVEAARQEPGESFPSRSFCLSER